MSLAVKGADRSAATVVAPAEPSLASVGDYFALMKPRVMSLVVFTAFVGLMVAPGPVHPVIGATALLCIAVGAGAAGALNMWYDADIDAIMTRTAGRPIPQGRILPGEALAFVRKERAAANPWGPGATSLEWTLPSPPPFHQYETLPLIR